MIAYQLPQQKFLPWHSGITNTVSAISESSIQKNSLPPLPVKVETMSGARLYACAGNVGVQVSLLDSDAFAMARNDTFGEVKALSDQWRKLVLDRHAPITANALTATVKPLFRALSRLGAGAVDLRDLPIDQVNGIHLAVVLRATLSFKKRTPGWDEALSIARAALRRDNINEADALMGLI